MKEIFKKSSVFKNFKGEEDKEIVNRQQCVETQNQIEETQQQYIDLEQKYNSLEKIMIAQNNGNQSKPIQ